MQNIDMPVTLPDGSYTDHVTGKSFNVAGGRIAATLSPLQTVILY